MDSGGLLLGEMTRTKCYQYSVMRDVKESTKRDRRRGIMQVTRGNHIAKRGLGLKSGLID